MTTTTQYGTWVNMGTGGVTVEDGVAEALSDWTEEYDVEAIAADYRAAINAALPDGVTLDGDIFHGPWPSAEGIEIREIPTPTERHEHTQVCGAIRAVCLAAAVREALGQFA